MDYVPQINEAKPLKSIPLATGKHTAVLLADIKSSGSVKYEFILVVLNDETDEPCLFVTSEVNTFAKTIGGSSHFLGLFRDIIKSCV
jgi:hypothetical protein